jgi:hypothetical protein
MQTYYRCLPEMLPTIYAHENLIIKPRQFAKLRVANVGSFDAVEAQTEMAA